MAFGIVVAMTITPLPLPPSWLVLAYVSLELDADPAGVVVAGALGAGVGRVGLAAWTRALGPRLMRPGVRANVDYLAERLRGRRGRLGTAALLAVSPPPPAPSTRPPGCCGSTWPWWARRRSPGAS